MQVIKPAQVLYAVTFLQAKLHTFGLKLLQRVTAGLDLFGLHLTTWKLPLHPPLILAVYNIKS